MGKRVYKIECWKCDNGKGAKGYIKGPDFDIEGERFDKPFSFAFVYCNHCTAQYIVVYHNGKVVMYEWITFSWSHLHKLQHQGRFSRSERGNAETDSMKVARLEGEINAREANCHNWEKTCTEERRLKLTAEFQLKAEREKYRALEGVIAELKEKGFIDCEEDPGERCFDQDPDQWAEFHWCGHCRIVNALAALQNPTVSKMETTQTEGGG